MSIIRNLINLGTGIYFMLFISVFTIRIASADNQPAWYQYAIAGDQTYKAKNYPTSQCYYLGALTELEKLAAKKQRLHLPRNQELELDALYAYISNAFCEDPLALYKNEQKQNEKTLQLSNFAKAALDPSYADKLIKQSQDDYNKQGNKISTKREIDRPKRHQ